MPKQGKSYRMRIVGYREIPAKQIKASPYNWRLHLDQQRHALQASLEQIGIVDACVVRQTGKDTYELVDGHLRTDMLGGEQAVPCLVTDLTTDEARKQITVHDPISAMAGQDTEMLSKNLKWLAKQDDTLSKMVFPDYIIDPMLAADWSPTDKQELPTKGENDHVGGHASDVPPIIVTVKEMRMIKPAIKKWKDENPDDVDDSDGLIIAKICKYFTS